MERTTLSLKVSKAFIHRFRAFCDANALSIGKFAELQLSEVMEDFYFGSKAQQVLIKGDQKRKTLSEISKNKK